MKLNLQNIEKLRKRKGCRYMGITFHCSKENDHKILGEDEEKGTIQILKDE